MLFDIGANLTHEDFHRDFENVLSEARNEGVNNIMITGASVVGSEQASQIASDSNWLYATAGIHPHHSEEADDEGMKRIENLLSQAHVKAVGETGLDFFRDFSPRDQQAIAFERHIELAIEYKLPMFLHERDAFDEFYGILARKRDQLTDIVVHCFTGDEVALDAYLELDCHIGITGWICDERRGTHLLPLVKKIPSNRLLIETDAPYLLPRTLRPKPKSRRNEPKHLAHICDFIATTLEVESADLALQTSANARQFFQL